MTKTVYTTHSPEETIALAEKLGAKLRAGDVIAYLGDLGAGKTTFTRGLARGMGLSDLVTSPTFALVHTYGSEEKMLCHFDMYRISGEEELETTGFYDYPMEECVFAVEWSENILSALPENCIRIAMEHLGDEMRRITIEGDERFADPGT